MSFDEALERADTTRFVVAAERRSSAPWLRHMAAHRESAAQRGTQWRRQAPVNRRVDPLPPEPETVQSSSDDDAVRQAAGYCEVLPRACVPCNQHFLHSTRNRVYETVERRSFCPSVCPIDLLQQRWPAGLLLSALRAEDIDGQRRAAVPRTSSNGVAARRMQQQMRAVSL